MQQTPILTLSAVAAAAVTVSRFVGFNGQHAAAAAAALGVADYAAATGKQFAVTVLGTAKVQVAAPVAPGALLEVGAEGKGAPLAAGKAVARVLVGTTAADGFAEVLLLPATT